MSKWTTSRMLSSVWLKSLYVLFDEEKKPVFLGTHFGTFPSSLPPFTFVKWRTLSPHELLHVEKLRHRLDKKMFENRILQTKIRSKDGLCAKCRERPRLLKQVWCKGCFADYYKQRKTAKQKKRREPLDIEKLLDLLEKEKQS